MYIIIGIIYAIILGIIGCFCSMSALIATGFGCVCLIIGFGLQDIISEIKKGRK